MLNPLVYHTYVDKGYDSFDLEMADYSGTLSQCYPEIGIANNNTNEFWREILQFIEENTDENNILHIDRNNIDIVNFFKHGKVAKTKIEPYLTKWFVSVLTLSSNAHDPILQYKVNLDELEEFQEFLGE